MTQHVCFLYVLGACNTERSFPLAGCIPFLLTTHHTYKHTANIIYKTGQPALVYIVPSLILSLLATGAVTGQFEQMWAFNAGEESAQQEA